MSFLLVLILFPTVLLAQGTWTSRTNFPGSGRSGSTSFTIGNTVYYTTGLIDGTGSNSQNWAYNISTNSWVQKATAPFVGRFYAVSFVINGKGYLGSGNLASSRYLTPVASNDFYEYNPSTDAWSIKNSVGPIGRYGAVGFSIGTNGYIGTGASSTVANNPFTWVGSLVNSFFEYNPTTGLWLEKNPHPAGAINAQVFVLNGKSYISGGFAPGVVVGAPAQAGVTLKNTREYNPASNSWTARASIPDTYQSHNAMSFSILDRGYSVGGHLTWSQPPVCMQCCDIYQCYLSSVLKYNPYLDSWSVISSTTPLGLFARGASSTNCDYGYVTTGVRQSSGYNLLNYKYSDSPDSYYLTGPSLVCSSPSSQFNLQLSNSASITWTTSSNLSINSGQGTKTVNISSTSNGSGWVQASFNNGCRVITFPQKSVYSGAYSSSDYPISGPYSACPNQVVYYSTNTLVGATNYSWIWPSGWTYMGGQGTPNLTLMTGSSSDVVLVRVDNTCGTGGSYANMFTSINSCGGFASVTASPNPASSDLNVSIDPLQENSTLIDASVIDPYEVVLFSPLREKVFQTMTCEKSISIPVQELKNGVYYLNVTQKGRVIQKQIQIKK